MQHYNTNIETILTVYPFSSKTKYFNLSYMFY